MDTLNNVAMNNSFVKCNYLLVGSGSRNRVQIERSIPEFVSRINPPRVIVERA